RRPRAAFVVRQDHRGRQSLPRPSGSTAPEVAPKAPAAGGPAPEVRNGTARSGVWDPEEPQKRRACGSFSPFRTAFCFLPPSGFGPEGLHREASSSRTSRRRFSIGYSLLPTAARKRSQQCCVTLSVLPQG